MIDDKDFFAKDLKPDHTYYNRAGQPISEAQWRALKDDTRNNNRLVAEKHLTDGKWITTEWTGYDRFYGNKDKILIFNTLVFDHPYPPGFWNWFLYFTGIRKQVREGRDDHLDIAHYETHDEAVAGHAAMLAQYQHEDGRPKQ